KKSRVRRVDFFEVKHMGFRTKTFLIPYHLHEWFKKLSTPRFQYLQFLPATSCWVSLQVIL
ncbi:MAG: hypothetical protein ACP5JC_04530, partial [Candidatus Micrarchaeia archaeon]